MTISTDVMQRIIDILKAETALDDIVAFVRGGIMKPSVDKYPYCEIYFGVGNSEERNTATRYENNYRVDITFFNMIVDNWNVVSRVQTVPSVDALGGYVEATKKLFMTSDNLTLQSLSGSYWSVVNVDIADLAYGYRTDELGNNVDNYGAISLTVITAESV